MLTVANCYLLWGLTWLQFVTTLGCFSFSGRNLWFYTVNGEPLGMTIPESFFAFSIALSVFAVAAVMGATWNTPRLWKRLFAVCLFAGMAIGLSCLSLHLRHYSYDRAIESHAEAHRIYYRKLTIHYNSTDDWIVQDLEWARRVVEEYDAQLQQYREKYDLPQAK